MFTLEQQIFIVQCFFSNGERLGPIRHLEFLRNFNKSFRTFKALNQQLAQKVYKCVNMFLETGSVLRKKGSRRPTKRSAENIERVNKELLQRLTQETNLSFGTVQLILKKDLHFFLYRVSVVHEITP
jgi:phosphate uptake regulator